jgi:ferredoxin-type protein NapH
VPVQRRVKMRPKRQRLRRGIIFTLFLGFPLTINYFSPVLGAMGAEKGTVTGSLLLFGFVFVLSLGLGRVFCGWVCPIGGFQEACLMVRDRKLPGKRIDWIKYAVWAPWIALLLFLVIRAGGFREVHPFFLTEKGISVSEPSNYVVFYGVMVVFTVLAFAVGRRAFCHVLCWIAPFMVVGRKLRNVFRWPSLELQEQQSRCIDCMKCSDHCPMSLDVNGMVRAGRMENSECILCGSCVDVCPKGVISYGFRAGR